MGTRKVARPANQANALSTEVSPQGGDIAPRLAIVIPVYKHSVLMSEAVESALAQQADFGIAIIIVDDGCPFPETETIGTTYAAAHDNVFYVRKPNGGLSSARNYGVDFAIDLLPDLEAVYFLDADNRITPTAMRSGGSPSSAARSRAPCCRRSGWRARRSRVRSPPPGSRTACRSATSVA